jgi:hypothetical protein
VHSFPRPAQTHLHVERTAVAGSCPECGGSDLATYRVLSEGGWWQVEKCQSCLASLRRTPAPALGSFTPLGSS